MEQILHCELKIKDRGISYEKRLVKHEINPRLWFFILGVAEKLLDKFLSEIHLMTYYFSPLLFF